MQALVETAGPMPAARACHIITQVAAALEAAHRTAGPPGRQAGQHPADAAGRRRPPRPRVPLRLRPEQAGPVCQRADLDRPVPGHLDYSRRADRSPGGRWAHRWYALASRIHHAHRPATVRPGRVDRGHRPDLRHAAHADQPPPRPARGRGRGHGQGPGQVPTTGTPPAPSSPSRCAGLRLDSSGTGPGTAGAVPESPPARPRRPCPRSRDPSPAPAADAPPRPPMSPGPDSLRPPSRRPRHPARRSRLQRVRPA